MLLIALNIIGIYLTYILYLSIDHYYKKKEIEREIAEQKETFKSIVKKYKL